MALDARASPSLQPLFALAIVALCLLVTASAASAPADANPSDALKALYIALNPKLDASPLGRPLLVDSSEHGGELRGQIFARTGYPFEAVRAALRDPARWCDILILSLNTKRCQAKGDAIALAIGRTWDQPADRAQQMEFQQSVVEATRYLRVDLKSPHGPIGTSDYRIALEAVAIAPSRTFIRLSYEYHYNAAAKAAMLLYLRSEGDRRIGFTQDGGAPVRGMRGVMERNTMRYFLAVDAYLHSLSAPKDRQLGQRLAYWFEATEKYPKQLHEIDREQYLAEKKKDTAASKAG